MKYKMYGEYTVCENGDIYSPRGKKISHSLSSGNKRQIKIKSVDGKRKSYTSSRFIYCVMNDIDIDTFDKNKCIIQIDGDNDNLHLSNLKCVDRADLIQGEKHKKRAILSDKDVQDIVDRYNKTKDNRPINQYDKTAEYDSYRKLAKEYGVTYAQIRNIIKGSSRNKDNYKLK